MKIYIRVAGPYNVKGHVGPRAYWTVDIYNEALALTYRLVPWNESASLSYKEAMRLAETAARVMEVPVREFIVTHTAHFTVEEKK